MAIKRSNEVTVGAGTFFKPKDHADAFALLVEPKIVKRDVEYTPYQKNYTEKRDEVVADVTVFASASDLDNGKGVEHKGMTFTHPGLVNMLSHNVGDSMVGRMGQKVFKQGSNPAWVLDLDVIDDATFDKVLAYYEAREAAVSAALDSAPDFD